MSRRKGKILEDFIHKFVSTGYKVDNGVIGKTYSVVLPDCKVLMKYPDRSVEPEIEIIKFKDIVISRRWDTNINDIINFYKLNEYRFISKNIQKSKQLDHNNIGSVFQIGEDKFFVFRRMKNLAHMNNNINNILDVPSNGTQTIIPIKNKDVSTVEEILNKYFQNKIYIFKENRILITQAIEEEVPTLRDYFTKSELELSEKVESHPESFLHSRSYWRHFTYDSHDETIKWEQLQSKIKEIRDKIEEKRILYPLKQYVSFLKWNPGCESISDGVNLFIKGPWEIREPMIKEFKEFQENVIKNWHTVYLV